MMVSTCVVSVFIKGAAPVTSMVWLTWPTFISTSMRAVWFSTTVNAG